MRICILSPIYPTKSKPHLGSFVHEQAKYLAKENNNVHVVTLGNVDDKDFEVTEGVYIYRVKINRLSPFKSLFFAISLIMKLFNLNKKLNFDVIHAHFVGPLTIVIGLASNLIKKPFVLTAHGIGLLSDNTLKKLLIKIYLSFPSKIICVSSYISSITSKFADKSKIAVINNGVDPEKLKIEMDAPAFRKKLVLKKEKILLSVGNLAERKGIDIILKSLPNTIKQYSNLKYFIIGDGPEKENLHRLVNKLGLKKYVAFAGKVKNNELANFYNICDVFILMSRTIKEKEGIEGFGIAYIEASYFGKPVIGGKSGGTADAIVDKLTGYRIEPSNTKELTEKIVLLLKDIKLRRKLGKQGMMRVKSNFLWSHNAEKLIKVYESLVKKHGI